ncbi:hypothetical protein EWE75_23510 [Sphingomonas populi]|uniref:Uncharacterized protein n=1 Tax=Sphingomonas populi TaxID=2484750 RepID=A0A4Q6XR10_9SPHN|nr:hypothetical protein [Sphingomonas populi]RZF59119.1 hypothetical protein EWE75_23510 [Sphingomonas populi]
MSKKTGKSKQRDDWVYGIVDARETGEISIRYDSESGKIELVDALPGSTKVERSYKRDGKTDKVVASIPQDVRAPFDPDDALKTFDNVVVMDTNKRTIAGKVCAVCMSYVIPVKLNEHSGDIPYNPLAAYLIIGVKDGVNPERIGWHLTLTHNILPAYDPLRHGKMALVTDSELGLHKDINARNVGYYGDNLLPDGITLVYASDKETDTLGGMILKACHNGAKGMIDEFRKRVKPFEGIARGGDGNFEAFAHINFQRG